MKRIILTFAVAVISTISICAQENKQENKEVRKSPEERTERIVSRWKTDLALSDDQVNKLKPVVLKREQQRDELRAKMNNARDQHRRIAKETVEDFKNILTPEQMEKLKQQRKEMRERHEHRKGDMHRDMNEKQ